MPRETLERARRHAKIIFAFPHLFTRSETMLAIRFAKQWGLA
jgi:hypothetical protein